MLAYVDSCVHIYYIEVRPIWAPRATALFSEPGSELATSSFVLLECLVGPFRAGDALLAGRFVAWLDGSCRSLALSRDVGVLAAELRARAAGLKTPDALHLACAIHHACDEFWTNDGHGLEAAASGRIRVRTLAV